MEIESVLVPGAGRHVSILTRSHKIKSSSMRTHVIVIDVAGYGGTGSLFVEHAVRAVRTMLASLSEEKFPLRVVLIAYDAYIHLYSAKEDAEGVM